MSTAIFIKTWSGDLQWLDYCLQSIRKYVSGISEVVIAADVSCVNSVYPLAHDSIVMPVPDWKNGYIQQQWVKLNADMYTAADQILFVDSDCVFHSPFTPESFMQDGKPVLLKAMYSEIIHSKVGLAAQKWRTITEGIVKWSVEWEYMRRLPTMFRSSTLKNVRIMFPDLESHLRKLNGHDFSEFNLIGAFIEHESTEDYSVIDTHKFLPPAVATQFWSWGGITPEIKNTIEGYLV